MPSSRPMPLSFMPPNGHCGVAGTGSLMPMIPASSPSAILPGDRQVVGEDIGRQAIGRVVGGGDHVVDLGEIQQRHDRGERLLGHDLHVARAPAEDRRLEEVALVESLAASSRRSGPWPP